MKISLVKEKSIHIYLQIYGNGIKATLGYSSLMKIIICHNIFCKCITFFVTSENALKKFLDALSKISIKL